jgi:hypothetical protein
MGRTAADEKARLRSSQALSDCDPPRPDNNHRRRQRHSLRQCSGMSPDDAAYERPGFP